MQLLQILLQLLAVGVNVVFENFAFLRLVEC